MKVEWTVCVRAVENIFALFAIKSNGNLLSKVHVTVPSARHRTAEEQVKTFNSPTMKYTNITILVENLLLFGGLL